MTFRSLTPVLLVLAISFPAIAQFNIVPRPVSIEQINGSFTIADDITISYSDEELKPIAEYLNDLLFVSNWKGYELSVIKGSEQGKAIILQIDKGGSYENDEAYTLSVNETRVIIKAPGASGVFYGVQTLRQLLPVQIEHTDPSMISRYQTWEIPGVEIVDYPRFQYRGLHLDVARHFFPVEFVKKYIDLLATFKMNRFHWHLTEDQGWRIEIKQYPKLTEIGAWRDSTLIGNYGSGKYDGIRHGGFYTQEQVKEVVQYAAERQVTIIPEIEMPGHSSAALAAYPELGCFDKEYHVTSTWGVFEDIYCPKEETFEFLENVLDEVIELFPGTYIHIGGDEAPKKQWEESPVAQEVIEREGLADEHKLQSYFIHRIEKYLNSKGKQIIGWDEILEGGLAPQATVMSWRGEAGGIEAAKMGHDVIMTPGDTNYLDHYQDKWEEEPIAIGGLTTLEDVYHYEPIPDTLTSEEAKYVLGAQGNVWTEYMHTPSKVEYMAYPRAIALSEVLWSPVDGKSWDDFQARIQTIFKRLDIMGVNYGKQYKK